MNMSSFVRKSLFLSFPVILLHVNPVNSFAQCYYPDGSIPQDYIWEPCTGAQYSSCCVPSEGDICQENGLCYYPDIYDDGGFGTMYRGTCTDRTWNDPACNADICVSGFETTWVYLAECNAGPAGAATTVCGTLSDDIHQTATCPGNMATITTGILTTTSTTSARRYTAPSSVNTAIYSVYTSTYTISITANAQSTTMTSTYMSTFTSVINEAVVTGTITSAESGTTAAPTAKKPKKTVTIRTGTLIAIIVGPIFAMILLLAIVLYCYKKRAPRQNDAIRLNSAVSQPPPNGPVGADQVYPYEVDVNEVANPRTRTDFYGYKPPKVDAYEIDDRNATLGGEKLGWGKVPGAMEIGGESLRSPVSPLRSPAPTYAQAMMPVELDGTSSLRTPSRG